MDHMCSARSFVFASLEKHDVVRGGVWQVSGKSRERLENWQESKNILGKTAKKSNRCWESRSKKKRNKFKECQKEKQQNQNQSDKRKIRNNQTKLGEKTQKWNCFFLLLCLILSVWGLVSSGFAHSCCAAAAAAATCTCACKPRSHLIAGNSWHMLLLAQNRDKEKGIYLGA